jgi:polyisoprenoid-binding protein YceI
MRGHLRGLILATIAVVMCACAADPSADKPKATAGNVAPETSSAKGGETEALVITPENSKVEFVASKVTRSHNGSFKQFAGQIDLNAAAVPNSRVTIDIETSSVVADDDQLTGHLKTPDFFDVAKFPKATFVSTKIEPGSAADSYNVTGNFDLHGVKKSISFPATIKLTPDKATVDAEFSINRKDFGIVYAGKADDLIRDGVVIKLSLNVPRKK